MARCWSWKATNAGPLTRREAGRRSGPGVTQSLGDDPDAVGIASTKEAPSPQETSYPIPHAFQPVVAYAFVGRAGLEPATDGL